MENKQYQELKQIVLDKAKQYVDRGENISWARIENAIQSLYPDVEITRDAIRAIYRRNYDKPYMESKNKYANQSKQKKKGLDTLQKVLKRKLRTKTSLQYLLDVLPIDSDTILAEVVRLELEGYEIDKWTEDNTRYLQFKKRRHDNHKVVKLDVKDKVSVLVISDTHIGHERSEIGFMQSVVKYAYDQGVRDVLHVGDWVEGNYQSIRPTSIKELDAIGFDDQVELAEQSFPKLDGLTYYGISGKLIATTQLFR